MNGIARPVDDRHDPPPPPSYRPSSPPPPPPEDGVAPPPPPLEEEAPPPPPVADDGSTLSSSTARPRKGALPQKKDPLSIEEVLRKKREADEAASKPKFLSRAQREKLALEKRQKEVDELRRKQQAERSQVPQGVNGTATHLTNRRAVSSTSNGASDTPKSNIPTGPKAMRRGEVPRGPSALRNEVGNGEPDLSSRHTASRSGDVPASRPEKRPAQEDRKPSQEQAAAALIRQRYMGADQNTSTFSAKKKRRRTTEKKFNFEWNTEEDTSQDYNPLYQARVEANFYGRGRLGGFADNASDESAHKYAKALEERDHEAGHDRALELMEMERKRKEEGSRNALDKHWSEKRLDQMRERDWRIFKEDFNISTKGGSIPNPMRSWKESGLPSRLLEIVEQVGYAEPSAVQRAAIPIALQARDLIGVAVTGSGKTAAFILPLLVYISALPELNESTKNDGPYAIILAPTRELAQQIESEAKRFATPLGFKCVSITGGHSIEEQSFNMRDGAEIIIATPGRLVDCIERRVLVLSQCCYLILDEADRMIDLGFEEPVNKILDALPVSNEKPDTDDAENPERMSQHLSVKDRYRQTMMYTATMPSAVERIARKYLRRPAIVTIGNAGEAVETVEQRVEFIAGEERRKKRLQELLSMRETFPPPIIVFVNIKRNCDAVARDVKHMGFNAVTLHGSKTQEQREAALASLRRGDTDVLIATDLAGRGIDVQDVSLVINFNAPSNIDSYVHRIGRTGRAGKTGVAVTFLGNEDTDIMYDLRHMLQKSAISKVPEELRRHEAAQQKVVKHGGGGPGKGKSEDSGGFGGRGGNVGGT